MDISPSGPVVRVEIVLAYRDRQYVQRHEVSAGTRICDLLQDSQILDYAEDWDVERFSLAIHGQPTDPQAILSDGDRVEILRPLTVDPKQARRRRAQLKLQR